MSTLATDQGKDESFVLDTEDVQPFSKRVSAAIAEGRARTENRVALILVLAIVAALPLYVFAIWLLPDTQEVSQAFDRWFTVMGPLAGAAVGVGYSRSSSALRPS